MIDEAVCMLHAKPPPLHPRETRHSIISQVDIDRSISVHYRPETPWGERPEPIGFGGNIRGGLPPHWLIHRAKRW
jgi:hypothetical protein